MQFPLALFPSFLVLAGGLPAKSTGFQELEAIAQFVFPAYVAMNLGAVCTPHDPEFLGRNQGPRGHVIQYAEHVKDEAISSMNESEAATVLRIAANAAHSVVSDRLKRFASVGDNHQARAELIAWCQENASDVVRAFIADHDDNHAAYMKWLNAIKGQAAR